MITFKSSCRCLERKVKANVVASWVSNVSKLTVEVNYVKVLIAYRGGCMLEAAVERTWHGSCERSRDPLTSSVEG